MTFALNNSAPPKFHLSHLFALLLLLLVLPASPVANAAPTITGSTVPSNGTYKIGQNLDFTVTYSEAVTVTTGGGTPYVTLTLDTGGSVQAAYNGGSTTTTLTFRYTVATGNADANGIAAASSITLNGGTIKNSGNDDAPTTTLGFGTTTAVLVDGVVPTLTSIVRQSPTTVHTDATSVTWRVTFSEGVTGVDTADFALTSVSGSGTGSVASVSAVSSSVYDVVASSLAGKRTLRLDVNSSGTGIADTAGNALSGGYTAGNFYIVGLENVFDTTNLTLASALVANLAAPNKLGQRFTTGAAPATLSSVVATIGTITGTPSPVVTINTNNAGAPGTVVATLTNPASLSASSLNVWSGDVQLAASTTYWIVFAEAATTYRVSVSTASTGGSGAWLTNPDYVLRYGSNAGFSLTGTLMIALGATTKPSITSTLTASGTAGTAFTYATAATNTPTSYAATGLPTGLSIDTATGAITGTPTAAGTFNVTLTATNGNGAGPSATLVITVASAPLPSITSTLSANGMVGSTFTYATQATNTPTSYAATNLPNGLSINTATGAITGTPTTAGTYNVGLTATNGGGTGPNATLVITVESAPLSSITSTLSASGMVGSAFTYAVTATNTPRSYAATGLPSGLSIDTATGTITGTPTAAGTYNVGLTATNVGGAGPNATLVITVERAPLSSITSTLSVSGTVDSAFTYAVTATNTPTSYAATNLPEGLSIDTATGAITGTPTTAGTYNVGLTATNIGGIGPNATLVITVQPSPLSSITSTLSASGMVGSAFTYAVTATNTPTSYAAKNLPEGIRIDTTTGAITGTPVIAGRYKVGLTATNSSGTGRNATLVLTVERAPLSSITSTLSASGTVGSAFTYAVTATNTPTRYAATNLPAGLSIDTATGTITGTPTAAGTYNVGLTATNGGGTGPNATLVITVESAPSTPVPNPFNPGGTQTQTNLDPTAGVEPTQAPSNLITNIDKLDDRVGISDNGVVVVLDNGLREPVKFRDDPPNNVLIAMPSQKPLDVQMNGSTLNIHVDPETPGPPKQTILSTTTLLLPDGTQAKGLQLAQGEAAIGNDRPDGLIGGLELSKDSTLRSVVVQSGPEGGVAGFKKTSDGAGSVSAESGEIVITVRLKSSEALTLRHAHALSLAGAPVTTESQALTEKLSLVMKAGEVARFGTQGEFEGVFLGSLSGKVGKTGDAFPLALPRKVESFPATTLLFDGGDVPARLGMPFSDYMNSQLSGMLHFSQRSDGLMDIDAPAGGKFYARTIGGFEVVPGAPNGSRMNVDGSLSLTYGGIRSTWQPMLENAEDLADYVSTSLGMTTKVLDSGLVQVSGGSGFFYVVRPRFELLPGGTAAQGLTTSGNSLLYTTAFGKGQQLDAAFHDIAQINTAATMLGWRLSRAGDDLFVQTPGGVVHRLVPDIKVEVLQPKAATGGVFSKEGERLYFYYKDGAVRQGFTLQPK